MVTEGWCSIVVRLEAVRNVHTKPLLQSLAKKISTQNQITANFGILAKAFIGGIRSRTARNHELVAAFVQSQVAD